MYYYMSLEFAFVDLFGLQICLITSLSSKSIQVHLFQGKCLFSILKLGSEFYLLSPIVDLK